MAESGDNLKMILGDDFAELEQRLADIQNAPHIESPVRVDFREVAVDQVAGEQFRDGLHALSPHDEEYMGGFIPSVVFQERARTSVQLQTHVHDNPTPIGQGSYLYVRGRGLVALRQEATLPAEPAVFTEETGIVGRVHQCHSWDYTAQVGDIFEDEQGEVHVQHAMRHGAVLLLKDVAFTLGEYGAIELRSNELLLPVAARGFAWGHLPEYVPESTDGNL